MMEQTDERRPLRRADLAGLYALVEAFDAWEQTDAAVPFWLTLERTLQDLEVDAPRDPQGAFLLGSRLTAVAVQNARVTLDALLHSVARAELAQAVDVGQL